MDNITIPSKRFKLDDFVYSYEIKNIPHVQDDINKYTDNCIKVTTQVD
jgi:hypothetical protein